MRTDISALQTPDGIAQARVDPQNQREEQRLFRESVQRARSDSVAVSSAGVQQPSRADGGKDARSDSSRGRPS
jgi:hypothetical protein